MVDSGKIPKYVIAHEQEGVRVGAGCGYFSTKESKAKSPSLLMRILL
jgi:hypothetical protein